MYHCIIGKYLLKSGLWITQSPWENKHHIIGTDRLETTHHTNKGKLLNCIKPLINRNVNCNIRKQKRRQVVDESIFKNLSHAH